MKKLLKYLQLLVGNPSEPEYIEMSKATLRDVILAVEERDDLRLLVTALQQQLRESQTQKNRPQPDEPAAG